jgi:hypothetical protein
LLELSSARFKLSEHVENGKIQVNSYILYIQVYILTSIQQHTFQLGNYEVACFPRNSSYVDTKTKEAPAHVYIIPSIDSKKPCSFKRFSKIRFIGFADLDAVEVEHKSIFPAQVIF